jgi:hypothetical protein
MLRWVKACLLTVGFAALDQILVWWLMAHPAGDSPPVVIGTTLVTVLGMGWIAALTLHLRERMIGSVLLSLPASVAGVLLAYGILQGWRGLMRDGEHLLLPSPARWLFLTACTFAGLSFFRWIAHVWRRRSKAASPIPSAPPSP